MRILIARSEDGLAFLYFSSQVVNTMMMMFNVVVPREQLYKCMACV